MKKILTFQQLNESKSTTDSIIGFLQKISKKADTKKLSRVLSPYKKEIKILAKKYSTNGILDGDRIFSDLKSFNFGVSESWEESFDENEDNNIFLRYLYKFFWKFPKEFTHSIWEILSDLWSDEGWIGKFLSFMLGVCMLATAAILFILGYFLYEVTEHSINGLEKGKVQSSSFEPSHYVQTPHTYMIGQNTYTYFTTDFVANRWHIQVKGDNGRVEGWVTYSPNIGSNLNQGQNVVNDDDWTWEETESR